MDPPLRVREDWWVFERTFFKGKEGRVGFRKNPLMLREDRQVFEEPLKLREDRQLFEEPLKLREDRQVFAGKEKTS